MPLSLPLVLVIGATLVFGLGLLAVGVLFAWRDALRRVGTSPTDLQAVILPEIASIAARIEARLAAQEEQHSNDMAQLRQNISNMTADLEWLAGERMIEQAIEMCRDGLSNDRISTELGLQPDAVRTVRLLRTH